MSIVNDALKKAGKEFEFNSQGDPTSGQKPAPAEPDKKIFFNDKSNTQGLEARKVFYTFLIIAVFVSGAFVLYKNIHRPSLGYNTVGSDNTNPVIQSTLSSIEKNTPKAMKSQNVAKLNGIVYGDEDKWAIVNDKIVKEGDNLLGGEIISIARDFIKIGKKDGSEIVLNLK